jgi:hypothetical protein
MASVAIIVGGVVFVAVVIAILRWGKLPPFEHRDMLALIALLGTIGGAMILTFLKWIQTDRFNAQTDRLVVELTKPHPNGIATQVGQALSTITDALAWNLKLDSAGIIVVLLSLGLVISARTIKAKVFGNEVEMNGGDPVGAAQGARLVADAADTKATAIEQVAPSANTGASE